MISSNRLPADHFLSSSLNSFFSTQKLNSSLYSGAMSYFAISTSNSIAKSEYKNALLSAASALILKNILGDKMTNQNINPNLCPNCQNPYLNANNNQNNLNNRPLNTLLSNNNSTSFLSSPLFKGMLIGGTIAYLLCNKDAKDNLAKVVAKVQNYTSAALEEFKEQVEDAKASMQ